MAALDNIPVTEFASATLFAPLSSYLEMGIGRVEGWLSTTTASMVAQRFCREFWMATIWSRI